MSLQEPGGPHLKTYFPLQCDFIAPFNLLQNNNDGPDN